MLNKKSAFKPKAAVRRPGTGPGSQGAQRPSTAEPSKTPAPVVRESPLSQPQPAPHPATSASPVVDPIVSDHGVTRDPEPSSQLSEKRSIPEPAPVQEVAQASITPIAPAIVTEHSNEGAAPAPAAVLPEKTPPPAVSKEKQSVPSTKPTDGRRTRAKAATNEQPAVAAANSDGTIAPTSTAPLTGTTIVDSEPATASLSQESSATSPSQPKRTKVARANKSANQQIQPTTESTLESVAESLEVANSTRTRKRRAAAAPSEESGEQSTTAAPKKRTRKRAAPLPGEDGYESGQRAPKATRSQKRSRSTTEGGETEGDVEENTPQPKKGSSRPQREATPPDAENVEIDITQVRMADLAKDMHIGKKFSLHDELMERERAKRLRYNERRRRRQNGEDVDDAEEAAGESTSSGPQTDAQATPAAAAAAAASESTATEEPASGGGRATVGEQYQIIDGEIVLDHRSLQVDRHARAREEAGQMLEVEENDFTHHTTSATYLRRNLKPQQWTDDETDLFYQALSAFGTDFDTICRMFKGKTRKHIKLKFNREERLAPDRINAALVGQKTVGIDMEAYQRATGQEYETAEAIYAEQRRAEEEFEARQKAQEAEKAEEVRRKKEEVLAQLNSAVDGGAGGDGGGKKGKGRKRKAANVVGL